MRAPVTEPRLPEDVDDVELPPEVRAALASESGHEERQRRLDRLSQLVCDKRAEAVKGRAELGIEDIWKSFEEAYIGIDEVNQGHVGAPKWTKSPVPGGPLLQTGTVKDEQGDERATIYVRLTARYVDAATAKIAEIILAPDEQSFSLSATPIPSALAEDRTPLLGPDGRPLERDAKPQELPQPPQQTENPNPAALLQDAAPNQPPMGTGPGKPLTPADLAEEKLAQEQKKATRAETRIHDQWVETQYNAEARKVLFDAARIGVGVFKGPYAVRKKAMKLLRQHTTEGKVLMSLHIEEKLVPGVKWVSPWDFFPDKHCGESIHNGEHCFERDYITEKTLRGLKGVPGYLDTQIDRVIKEGPQKCYLLEDASAREKALLNDSRYQIWYAQMDLTRDDLLVLNQHEDIPATRETVSVNVTIVNDSIIQAIPNLLDSGEFMYDTMPWQRRAGTWAGMGLGEQLDTPQRIVNGATRKMMDNAGHSAGGQIVVDRSLIDPADGRWAIRGDKLWVKKGDSLIDDVRKAFTVVELPNATPALMSIVEYGFRLGEEVSNIPLVSQGQSGKTQPETLGGLQLQDNNANQLLRHIASVYDDNVTSNKVRHFYEWNMLDPDIPEDEKGDFQIHAQGSSALVERYVQERAILEIGPIVKDPAFGFHPRKWAKVWLRSKRLNPDDLMYSKDEQAKIDSQPPPPPPQVMAAQITAQASMEKVKADHQLRMQELEAKIQLETLRYANERQISLDEMKVKLADTTMKLKTQVDLAMMETSRTTPEVVTPPMEPPGRAPDGQAYQR